MLKFPCLVLDHDDTVVQTEKCIGYPYFRAYIERVRPGKTLSYAEYVADCNNMVFADMCREKWNFTDEELLEEYLGWKAYSRAHIAPAFDGIARLIHRQKAEGGLICVASLSTRENILRDYDHHFGIVPDAIYDNDLPAEQRKPNPWALADIMERYGLAPSEILLVDDMKLGWRMAKQVNVPTAFAAWGKADFPVLSREMHSICDYSFESPQMLEKFLFGE